MKKYYIIIFILLSGFRLLGSDYCSADYSISKYKGSKYRLTNESFGTPPPIGKDVSRFSIGKLDSLFGPDWDVKGQVYFHLSQSAQFNWAKGGENLFSSLMKSKLSAKYKKNKHLWDNSLIWNYGFLLVGNKYKRSIDYRTDDDLFEVHSSYGYKAANKLYYTILFNFKTQFFPSYKYPNDSVKVSNFLSPAYIIFSAGMNFEPNDNFSLMLSPLTSKSTIVIKQGKDPLKVDETKYGLKEGERVYKEVGAYLKLKYNAKILKEISVENQLNLFSNYQYKPQNIDVELKSDFHFLINKYLKAIVSLHFIYDDDAQIPVNEYVNGIYKNIGYTKGLQFEEKIMLGIGIEF